MELVYQLKYKLTDKKITCKSKLEREFIQDVIPVNQRYLKGGITRIYDALIRNNYFIYKILLLIYDENGRDKIIVTNLSQLKKLLNSNSAVERTLAKRMAYYLRKNYQIIDISIRAKIVEQKYLGNI